MVHHLQKYYGFARVFAVEQPYYLKHSPGNPWFGAVHDGAATEYNGGFTLKPIHWLYRFRWNSQRRGFQPMNLRNPGGKCPHWLEISQWAKARPHMWNMESYPHTMLFFVCSAIVIWNLSRYIFFHPDLTLYNLTWFSLKRYANILRNNQIPNLDTPVFRWLQQPSEFYFYHPHREMLKLGVIANDPYVEYIKAIGKQDLLIKMPGEPGYNTAMNYLPHFKWCYSYHEQGPSNPVPIAGAAAAAHH